MHDVHFGFADHEELEEIRQFLIEHDIVEVPEPCYLMIEALWPELIHKVKPPRQLMH